jgi:hypothetical protein
MAADGDGDGTCDLLDDCPTISDPGQADADGDNIGDACDPCTNSRNVYGVKSKITVVKLLTPPGDDKLKLKGSITIPPHMGDPAFDPTANSPRAIIIDANQATILDITVPVALYNPATKVGWKVNGTHTSFTYLNAGTFVPLDQGIKKFGLKASTKIPGLIKFTISGKTGSYDPDNIATHLPLKATIIFDNPYAMTGLCGEVLFPSTTMPLGACSVAGGGNVVKCK